MEDDGRPSDGSNPPYTIRKGVPEDLETVLGFNTAMAVETENVILPLDTVKDGTRAVLNGHVGASYYLLEVEGAVVAQLMITYEWSDWRASNIWWIQSVYVHPDHRKKGYFKALYDHVRREAQAAGSAGLRLYVDVDNKRAEAAYSRLGMRSHYKVYEDMFTSY